MIMIILFSILMGTFRHSMMLKVELILLIVVLLEQGKLQLSSVLAPCKYLHNTCNDALF